jgi:2-keto-3-deoxy-L-rhamnonate aldolase RhmA
MVLAVASDWHRDIHLHPFDDAEFAAYEKSRGSSSIVMPMIESRSAMNDLPRILALDGLKAVTLGLTDLTRMVGKPFQYEDAGVVEYATQIVGECHDRGIKVGANVGYTDSRDLAAMRERIARMTSQGFDFIWLQNNGFVVQWVYRQLLQGIGSATPA